MVNSMALIGNVPLINFILFIVLFGTTVFVANTLSILIGNFLKPKIKGASYKIPGKILQYFLIFSATYYGLQYILGFDFTAFVAAFGIIGIAVAFSAQQTIQNLIAGIFILGSGVIKLDNWVEVSGTPNTGLSQVKDISLTRTTLREDNGRLISVPNSIFIDNKIIKYPDGDFFKILFPLKISVNNDIEKIKKIVLDICNKNEKILPNIPKKEKVGLKKILDNVPEDHQKFLRFLRRRINIKQFEPVIILSDISQNILTLNVLIWIWDIKNKERWRDC